MSTLNEAPAGVLVTLPSPANRRTLTLAELADAFMAQYAGADKAIHTSPRWMPRARLRVCARARTSGSWCSCWMPSAVPSRFWASLPTEQENLGLPEVVTKERVAAIVTSR